MVVVVAGMVVVVVVGGAVVVGGPTVVVVAATVVVAARVVSTAFDLPPLHALSTAALPVRASSRRRESLVVFGSAVISAEGAPVFSELFVMVGLLRVFCRCSPAVGATQQAFDHVTATTVPLARPASPSPRQSRDDPRRPSTLRERE
jgi:hypothetical protein